MSKNLMPPPPGPASSQGQKQAVFDEVVLWLLTNYGLLAVGELRGDWQALAVREAKKRGRRIGVKDGANWRPCLPQRGQRAAAYARSEEARERWTVAAPALVLAELQKNETALAKLRSNAGRIPPFETVST